ncbi:MAG: hypothetical protein ACU0A5_18710 [Salipiger marinus]|uniref:hypothetical protein n=1 Tax=Salipiger marinus TaxID=555512 RepID=UPI004059B8BE
MAWHRFPDERHKDDAQHLSCPGLAHGRCAVICHHTSRRRAGHAAEADHRLRENGLPGLAVRPRAYSPRSFFVLNPEPEPKIGARLRAFCTT